MSFLRAAVPSSGAPKGALKLSSRNLALLALVGAALAAMLWYFYLYTPTQLRIADLTAQNQLLETDILRGRAARANLPELHAQVADLRAERDLFLSQLPEQNDVAGLLDQLRAAARDAGVGFTGLQNAGQPSEVVPGVRLLNFSLATQGNYARTIAFLRALEALPRFTRVQRVGLSANADNTSADPGLDATYDFTVYVYTGVDETAVGAPGVDTTGVDAATEGEATP